jgi:hypothetical protein
MSRLGKLQSACPLLLLALSLVSGSSIAGPPVIAAPVTAQQRIVATPPPGWPHNIYGAGLTTCNRNPGINVVIVYRDPNFGGSCAAMVAGFYPYPQYLGVGDDAISSIKWERVFERAASRTRRTAGATRCSRQGAATRSPRAPSSRRRSLALPRRSAVQCARPSITATAAGAITTAAQHCDSTSSSPARLLSIRVARVQSFGIVHARRDVFDLTRPRSRASSSPRPLP